jgi:hypothetical protein
MPIETGWLIPYRVIDARVWGTITMDDLTTFVDAAVTLLIEAQTHSPETLVYLLYDTSKTDYLPPIYMMLKPSLPLLRFKNRGDVFHIGSNAAIRSIMELTSHVTKFKLHSFATRDEAIRAVERAVELSYVVGALADK